MIVFISGIIMGSNDLIPWGGHTPPSSMVGAIEELKNAQNNERKRNTSDEINNIIPIFSPKAVSFVWHPCFDDSLKMSWAHEKVTLAVTMILAITTGIPIFLFQNIPIENRDLNPARAASRGQGLCSTMWFG